MDWAIAWLIDCVEIGDTVPDDLKLRIAASRDPFLDDRLRVAELPEEPQKVTVRNAISGAEKQVNIALFKKPGEIAGARRAISEIVKWMNYVTEGRFFTLAADLSESINVEHGSLWGHYDPVTNPMGTRIKAAIQEAGNVATAIGLVSQSASLDPEKFAGVWALSGTYGAFTPLMYTPARVWSQQNQDSKFRVGVLHILTAHSGPETAADARTHFGIFAPQVWKLFPRGQVINLSFWDYNDVGARILRGGGNRGSRSARRHHHAGGCAPRFRGSGPQPVRRFRSTRCGKRPVCHSRFRAWPAAAWLRHRAGVKLDSESAESAAATRRSWRERKGDLYDQRGVIRSPAAGVSRFCAAARGSLRFDGGINWDTADVAAA